MRRPAVQWINVWIASVASFLISAAVLGQVLPFQKPPDDPAQTHSIPEFAVPPAKPDTDYLRFLVIGDWGTGRADQHEVAKAMAIRLRAEPANFIMTVGDNFYEFGVSSVTDPQWKTKFEDVYRDPVFEIPFYASLGNHDHRGNVIAQVEYASISRRWKMPAEFYKFDMRLPDQTRISFFAIDTDPIKRNTPASQIQLGWMNRELQASDAQWKIVYGHHPVFSDSTAHGDERAMVEKVRPLFEKHKVDIYFAGHDHTLEMLKPIGGVNYVISGGGAGLDKAYGIKWTERAKYAATRGGFTAVRVCLNEMVIEFVRLDGKTQYAEVIPK